MCRIITSNLGLWRKDALRDVKLSRFYILYFWVSPAGEQLECLSRTHDATIAESMKHKTTVSW